MNWNHAVIAFTLVKSGFFLLGWYTRDSKDQVMRRGLDKLFDTLDSIPARELASRLLSRFARRWSDTFPRGWRGIIRFGLLSYVVNVLCFMILRVYHYGINGIIYNTANDWLFIMEYAGLGILLDYVLCYISLTMIRKYASQQLGRLLLVCLLDVIMLNYAITLNATLLCVLQIHIWQWSFLQPSVPVFRFGALIFTVAASIQTSIYLFIGFVALLLRLCPRWIQRQMTRLVFSVTTEDRPVFAQLGYLAGAVAALVAAIA